MDFGRIKNLDDIDFTLPSDDEANKKVLEKYKSDNLPKVFVGCPIWGVKEWIGSYYPASAREKDFLLYYAKQFNTIELNTTHYRIPDPQTVRKWYANTGEGFKFCPKLPQEISHEKKLRNVAIETQIFCENIAGLKEKLGVCFLQLPPYFSPSEINYLEDFLKQFPTEIPLAIEFRHEDFFKKSHFNKTFDLLEKYHINPVITDVAGRRDVLHQRFTTDTVLIRWVGDKLHPTDYQRVEITPDTAEKACKDSGQGGFGLCRTWIGSP
jgi:uncharacterized protein YecE (DUF72 family)